MASVKTRRILAVIAGLAVLAAIVLVALVTAPGTRGAEVLDVVPRGARYVVHLASPARFLERTERLAGRLGQAARTAGLRRSLERQVGFDPTDSEALAERGLDPDGGVVVFEIERGRPFAVFVVDDRSRFEAAFLKLVKDRAGAERAEAIDMEGFRVERTVDAKGGLLAAWTYVDEVVLFTGGDDAAARLASVLLSARKAPIQDDLWFSRAREAMGEKADLLAWTSSEGLESASPGFGDLEAAGLVLSVEDGLQAAAYLGLDAPRRIVLDPLPSEVDATGLVSRLDPEAVVAARLGIDPVRAWRLLRDAGLPRPLEELQVRLVAAGLDPEKDVLPLLEGTAAFDLRLTADPADLEGAGTFDPRRTNPFRFIRTSILVPLTDAKRAREVLARVAPGIGPALKARVEEVQIAGERAWTVSYRLGEGMTFGVVDNLLVITGGEGTYGETAARLKEGASGLGRQLSPELMQVLSKEGAAAVVVQVDALLTAARAAAKSAFGGGPDGLMIRSMVAQATAPLARVEHLSGVLERDPSGLVLRVELGLTPEESQE